MLGVQEQAARLRLIEKYVARWRLNRWSTNRDLRVAADFDPSTFDPKTLALSMRPAGPVAPQKGQKGGAKLDGMQSGVNGAAGSTVASGIPHPQRMMPVRAGEVVNVMLWSIRDGPDELKEWVRVIRVTDDTKTDGLIPCNCLANYGVIHRMNEAAVMLRATLRLQARFVLKISKNRRSKLSSLYLLFRK